MTPSRPFLLVGLTGGIATGKSMVDTVLRELGAVIIDADALAREVVEPGEPALAEIAAEFGPDVIGPDGRLDRKALGAIVFADPERRRRLEAITHPRIRERFLATLEALAARGFRGLVVFDAPVMIESGNYRNMDRLVVVITDEPTQVARLMARDGIGRDEALRKIASQMPLAEKARLADYVIENTGDRAATAAQTRRVYEALTGEADVSSRLMAQAGHEPSIAPLGVVFPINMGNRGQNTIPVATAFAKLRCLVEGPQFIAYHRRPSGNFVFVLRDSESEARATAAVSSVTGLDCVARRFSDLVRLDWHVPTTAISTAHGSVILGDSTGTWRAIGVFLSEVVAPNAQVAGELTPKIKVLSWPSPRDVFCVYDRPGKAGDVGQVSRAAVRKLRRITQRPSLNGSGRAIGVLRDIIGGRDLRS